MPINITPSRRLQSLSGYAFAEVEKMVATLRAQGVEPIDFGVGDPLDPTPPFIRSALQESVERHACTGYPSYIGSKSFRTEAANWMQRRFGVDLDPDTEISSTIGSKEAIFNFPEAILNPGDVVIIPSPGYPPMKTGTVFAEGIPYFVPLLPENNFLLDFESITEEVAKKAKIIWINYPNSPTGAVASKEYYKGLIAWARKYDILIAADEGCYIDIYFDEKQPSILEVEREGIIAFYSLSKRNNMTGYRVGFVAGDKNIISLFKKLKTNIDSGTPNFIQDAAAVALADETHVQEMRELYREKRSIMLSAFRDIGLPVRESPATFYLWQKAPVGMTSLDFTKRLLEKDIAIVTTPGSWISDVCASGVNPGEGYVRFALVPTVELCKEAATRLRKGLAKMLIT